MNGGVMRGKAVVTALAFAAALAGCGGPTKKQRAEYDENNRHYTPPSSLARADYGGMVERRFHALDRDDDGYLGGDEIAAGPAGDPIRMLDRDRDDRVSAQEFGEGMLARFDRFDLNRDGTMTWDEYQAVRRPPAPSGARHRRHSHRAHG